MIQKISLKNFRSFSEKEIYFKNGINIIIGPNGIGKTNILEAISLLSAQELLDIPFVDLLKEGESNFFLSGTFSHESYLEINLSLSYDKISNKKKYFLNNKTTTKQKILKESHKIVSFSPIIMNMMYLSPSLRRDFLDETIGKTDENHLKLYKKYKDILKNRNKILKNIGEQKSKKEELFFWDDRLIEYSKSIYKSRLEFIFYIKNYLKDFKNIFFDKVNMIDINYITKVDINHIGGSMKKYLDKNIDRDIILGKTYIGPHLDDFDILVNGKSLRNFASRGETKSIILGLKDIEMQFIEEKTKTKPILIIDDIFSELDDLHQELLLKKLNNHQSIITSISPINKLESLNIVL